MPTILIVGLAVLVLSSGTSAAAAPQALPEPAKQPQPTSAQGGDAFLTGVALVAGIYKAVSDALKG